MKITFSKAIFPNFATGLNVFSGFVSIVFASQNDFKMAAIFIFIAAFFDLLDGIIARILKTSSLFGVELDSLADVVSFCAAPSFLLYKTYFSTMGWPGILLSSLLLLFGTFRLARFNVQIEDISTKLDFKGLPVPVPAVFFASLVLFFHNGLNIVEPLQSAIIPVVILLSGLMVSNVKYNTLPKVKYLNTATKSILIFTSAAALLAVILTDGRAFFYLVSAHIVFGILRYLYFLIFNEKKSSEINFN